VSDDLILLLAAAASLAFVHTLVGVDHYLPFVVLARARDWSLRRTLAITLVCGCAHVLSSFLLGGVGIAAGIGVSRLEEVEGARGSLAAWALIAFGAVYGAWGLHRALRSRGHREYRFPSREELAEAHRHDVVSGHHHHHHRHHRGGRALEGRSLTPWVLFVLFALGPCEPLIPVLMYPAAMESALGVALVVGVFGTVTLATMALAVLLGLRGVARVPLPLERYGHALAGAAILVSGVGIRLLGL
jgi:sulfite exporter TauE/SafE